MRNAKILIALGLVVVAVLIQTTLFQHFRPFGYAPALGMLTVIAVARHLEPEPALFVAFTGGLIQDLLGAAPLGLWASAFTVVAFITLKVREREVAGPIAVLGGVFGLTLTGLLTFAILGTLFGQSVINRPGFLGHLVVPAALNVILAYPAFWLARIALRPGERTWAA
ncbi:MAG: rod shape-determining protein MreD [Actinomycetota bacterium]